MPTGLGPKRRAKLRARDGDRCCYCHRRMWFTRRDHPRSPTIEHIVRQCDGGTHAMSNQKLACMDCNTRRGDRSYQAWKAIRSRMFQPPKSISCTAPNFRWKLRHFRYLESFT